jgi:predicted nucleic acid-binding protein
MAYLIDTNVISEIRKAGRCNPGVAAWFAAVKDEDLFLSVLVVGELERGIARIGRRDRVAARKLERWLTNLVNTFEDRILPITLPISRVWGKYGIQRPLPTIDGLLAASAQHHGLILVTRNTKDVSMTGVQCMNPFEDRI